jgi:hypothetical protein
MYADAPAIAYWTSWRDFFRAEIFPHQFFNFFTSSCPASLASQEGSQEWEILYRKYYNDEVKKLGI